MEAWREDVLAKVEHVGKGLKPDGSWADILLMDTPVGLEIVSLSAEAQEDPRVAAAIIVERKARLIALIRSAWQLVGDEARDVLKGKAPRPRENPKREEIVLVFMANSIEDATYKAVIRRSDGPPTLGEWSQSRAAVGAFIEPLRAAVQVAAARN
jgi:hypothetical protein